jgi:GMP synthase-like glutamine amidotransferase
MDRAWVVIQHVSFEGPGQITAALKRHGTAIDVRRMDLGEGLPEPAEIAGLVVMGGPMGALDDSAHPHLAAERALLKACVERDIPVLAVCLGAQLLAAALGARVFTGAVPEIGLGTVGLTAQGRRDAVFGPVGHVLPVLHWHNDTFELPTGATLLASSELYANQAYRIGSAYALQFHVEIGASQLPQIEGALPSGVRIDRRHLTLVSRAGSALLERFVAHAGGGTAAAGAASAAGAAGAAGALAGSAS